MPPREVFLHIGAPKTGTTYVQHQLDHLDEWAPGADVAVPLSTHAHFEAALDLRGVGFTGWAQDATPPTGAFDALVAEVRRLESPRLVISSELFVWCGPEQVRRAVEALAPAEVHVVYSVRRLDRLLASAWQEDVKNGARVSQQQWMTKVAAGPASRPWGRWFWGAHDAPVVLDVWAQFVPRDRVHVLTIPEGAQASGVLRERFAAITGLPTAAERPAPEDARNRSLGYLQTELLRQVNVALRRELPWPRYDRLVKNWLATEVMPGAGESRAIVLPHQWRAWAEKRSAELIDQLAAGGFDIVGDLEEIRFGPDTPQPAEDSAATDSQILDTAVAVLAEMLRREVPSAPPDTAGRAASAQPEVTSARQTLSQQVRQRLSRYRRRERTTP